MTYVEEILIMEYNMTEEEAHEELSWMRLEVAGGENPGKLLYDLWLDNMDNISELRRKYEREIF